MPLFDNNGKEQYYNSEEVLKLMRQYHDFYTKEEDFIKNQDAPHAKVFLIEINKMKEVPTNIRHCLLHSMGLGLPDIELKDLESECRKYISSPKKIQARK